MNGDALFCPTCGRPNVIESHTARNNDRGTAVRAGERHKTTDVGRFGIKSQKARLLRYFESADNTHQGAALAITPAAVSISVLEGCRRRCSELLECGYLMVIGEAPNRGSDTDAMVCSITPAGQEALARLRLTGWSKP